YWSLPPKSFSAVNNSLWRMLMTRFPEQFRHVLAPATSSASGTTSTWSADRHDSATSKGGTYPVDIGLPFNHSLVHTMKIHHAMVDFHGTRIKELRTK